MKRAVRIAFAAALLLTQGRMAPAVDRNGPGTGPAVSGRAAWNLDNVVSIALASHPLVRQADANRAAAEARNAQAGSPYYPQIDLSAGASRSRVYSTGSKTSSTGRETFVQGTLSQRITDFGRTGNSVDRSGAQLSSAAETAKSVREDIAFNAKVAYFNVLRSGRILDVGRETVAQRESLLRRAQAFYEAGFRARIDVARAEANLYQARADLTVAGNNLKVARITLLNRMGIDGPADFELVGGLDAVSVPGAPEDWIREAEANRPDLRSLLEQQRAAELNVRVARGGYYPVLTGNASYGYAGEDSPDQRNHSLSLQLSVPVFSGFLTRRQVAEAEAQLASARHAVTDFRRQVRLEVERAALSVRAASEIREARGKEKEASAENLRLATGRYEVGAGDIIEMIDAQVQMTASDTDLVNSMFDYSVSVASLQRAIGRSTEGGR